MNANILSLPVILSMIAGGGLVGYFGIYNFLESAGAGLSGFGHWWKPQTPFVKRAVCLALCMLLAVIAWLLLVLIGNQPQPKTSAAWVESLLQVLMSAGSTAFISSQAAHAAGLPAAQLHAQGVYQAEHDIPLGTTAQTYTIPATPRAEVTTSADGDHVRI